jgi:phage/conjugal plasmid C-4 type zinc finger TraR family protein
MPDEFDRAAERELQLRDDAIRDQRLRAGLGDATAWRALSAYHCLTDGCGVAIPEARRRALPGVQTCVDCQQQLERGGRR